MLEKELERTFGEEGTNLECTCSYYGSFVYDFIFHLRGIEEMNSSSFCLVGDISEIDDNALPESLKKRIVLKKRNNIELIYNIGNKNLSFHPGISGVTIYPENNGMDSWCKLLGLVGDYISGLMKDV